ncbi:hypothetical protein C5B99_04065 [Pseudoclavibacter sp. Z016]|nr:hypothetical protein C5B99_04065 [Pseudoclavibacter sp. Z016]
MALIPILFLAACSGVDGEPASAPPAGSNDTAAAVETQAPPAAPLDLTGDWVQTNSNSESSYQAATISDGEIVINWVNDAESTSALYWAGTYVAPTEDVESYTWDSANDTTQTESALMASGDATKVFTFEGDVLTYELTALGVTMTVEMSRQ